MCPTSDLRLRDVSRWDFTKELEDLLSTAASGDCSDKVRNRSQTQRTFSFRGEETGAHLTLQILTNVIVCLKLSVLWALHSIDENNPERVSRPV